MRRILLSVFISCFIIHQSFSQVRENSGISILFHGLVIDAGSLSPIPNSQITINRSFSALSGSDGSFAFYVNRNDTVVFKSLGFKPTIMFISDTLAGREFIAGIYMRSDTLSIGEVIIIPRFTNLKSEILNAQSKTPATMDNAKYNIAVSAYAGRSSINTLSDPASNYGSIKQKQKVYAQERGGIPSDQIAAIHPLMLIPLGYALLRGFPDNKPAPVVPNLTPAELNQLNKMYLESLSQKK
jgi:hypothetical protein